MSNVENPASNAENGMTLSIRMVRSFEHRNIRYLVVRHVGQMTGGELKERILTMLPNEKVPPPFKTFAFDTLKIEHYPHHAKTNDLVTRRDDDERLIIEDDKLLSHYNIVDGTEIAFFKRGDYEIYKQNPELVRD